jgi:hypothetical protein
LSPGPIIDIDSDAAFAELTAKKQLCREVNKYYANPLAFVNKCFPVG